MRADGALLQKDVAKEGAKAGEVFGASFNTSLKSVAGVGAGLELGRQALIGFEHVIGDVIDAIPNLIHQGQDFALTVDDISDKTGAAAETSSRFAGTLRYLGISTQGLGLQLKTLSDDIVNNEDKLNKLGIATRDSNGNLLDTITVLDNVRSYLSGAADGAAKMTLAADLLGRGAGTLVDYLNLTDEQAAALNKTLDDLGVSMGEDARHNAEALARETNLLGLAWQGFANMLFTEVAPTIRGVIAGITDFIKTHGAEIRETIVSMTQAVLGFVQGLIGMSGLSPFQTTLDGLGNSAADVSLSFEQWAQQTGRAIPAQEKLKTSTKGATDAIDGQIASTQKAIDVEKRRNDGQETVFQRTMKRLADEYGARVDSLDLAEREIDIDARKRDLNEQLNQAQLDLQKAQKGTGGGVDAEAVSAAMANIASIQGQQAENERKLAVDTQKARLEATQTYIEDIANLEADSENKKALAANLGTRRTALQGQLQVATAAKDAGAIADITAKLEAVKTAEERTAAARRSQAKQDELAGLKAQLEEQRKAIATAGQGQVTDNKKTLGDLNTQYQAYLDDQKTKTEEHVGIIASIIGGDAKTGTGLGGAITKAFADGLEAGQAFRTFLDETLFPAVRRIVDLFAGLVGLLGNTADELAWLSNPRLSWEGILGHDLTPPALRDRKPAGEFGGGSGSGGGLGDHTGASGGGFAMGGPVRAGVPIVVGERRPELFVPSERGTILPSLGESATVPSTVPGWMGGAQTIEVPVYLDGDVLTRVVSRRQADAMNR